MDQTHTLSNGDVITVSGDPNQDGPMIDQIETELKKKNAPPESFGTSVINKLRSMAGSVIDPKNRPALGGLIGTAISAAPAAALAPETGGLSLLLPALMAGVGGAAGSASADLGTSGKVDPARMVDQGLDQSRQQMMFGDIPSGVMRELLPPAARAVAMIGNRNALRPNVPNKVLDTLENPATGTPFAARGDALGQVAHDELVGGYGRVGDAASARNAGQSVDSAQAQLDAIRARAPKDRQGNIMLGMLPKVDTDTLAALEKDRQHADMMRGVLSSASKAQYTLPNLTNPHRDTLGRLLNIAVPSGRTAQAAWDVAAMPGALRAATGDADRTMMEPSNLMRLLQLLGGQ